MKILAIETSCDETAIALLECTGDLPAPSFKVLANNLQSQIHIHKEYGGVYPMLAKREHIKNLPILLEKTLKEGGEDFDYIAVTVGPGLEPALWTGIEFAKELGRKWGKPVIPVNHMEGHLWSVLYEPPISNSQFPISKEIQFPAVALLVSGGHTELVHVESFEKFEIIGRTKDDAVGEAFDKTARLLDLPYPGGPKISVLAEIARGKRVGAGREFPDADSEQTAPIRFPRPMIKTDDYDFSYSGLKTAVLYAIKKIGKLDEATQEEIAMEFENAAIEPLVVKTRRALEAFGAKTLLVGGGVSANKFLRAELERLAGDLSLDLRLPVPELTGDNAIMIGIAAYIRIITDRAEPEPNLTARGNLRF